jgi:hypothetical protein
VEEFSILISFIEPVNTRSLLPKSFLSADDIVEISQCSLLEVPKAIIESILLYFFLDFQKVIHSHSLSLENVA